MRILGLILALALGVSKAAFADPGVTVHYRDELLRVTLNGSYQGSYYQVWRSGELAGQYQPLASDYTLCTGDCQLADLQARPGQTYWYRFDLQGPGGGITSYGPYAVTVPDTPYGLRVTGSPSSPTAGIVLSLSGSARHDDGVGVRLHVLDLQGRVVKRLHSGPLPRGESHFRWDGRADDGRALGAGIFFVRAESPLGAATRRIVRVR